MTTSRPPSTAVRGVFQCDCRGVGTDWGVDELRSIAVGAARHGRHRRPTRGHGRRLPGRDRAARWQAVGDVRLRCGRHAAPRSTLRQAGGTDDRGPHRSGRARRRAHRRLPDRRVGDEGRDYHVRIDVPARRPATRCSPGGSAWSSTARQSQSLVRAVWTDDAAPSTRIDPRSRTTRQVELAKADRRGSRGARRAGDDATATSQLGRAAQLAAASGNDGTLRLLAGVVDIEDATTGTVRLQARRRRGRRDGPRHPLHEDGAR